MTPGRLPFVLLALFTLTGTQALRAQNSKAAENKVYSPLPGFDRSAMNTTADPCVDFYQFACGNFSKLHPVPPDLSEFDEFTNLREYNTQVLHKILENTAAAHPAQGSDPQKIGDYYASCMDTALIEKKGLSVLQSQLDAIAALQDKSELPALIAQMQKIEIDAFFNVGSQQDFKDATKEIAVVDQGGLGLPEKDYYLRTDAKSVTTREQYVQHLTNLLKLLGEPSAKAESDSKAVMDLETSLAKNSMGVVDRRDPNKVYHLMPVEEFAGEAPDLMLKQVLTQSGVPPVQSLNVATPDFFKGLQAIVQRTDLDTIKTYLRIRLVDSEAMRLPKAFDDEHFNFYGRQLEGTPQQEERSKRCVNATDQSLGEILGKSYVAEYFAGDSKAKTLQLVKEIEASMDRDLDQIDWMSPETKTKAKDKLQMVANKIGYPNKWRDYSSLTIRRDEPMGNSLRTRAFDMAYQLGKIGKPVNRDEWDMTPPTVNAYYDPSMNDINFPAGILQPAFYDKSAGDDTNYGHIGAVVGHELTHGFDDEGRQFDGKGNLVDWWTEADGKRFQERADCLVKQYDAIPAVDDLHVNGKLTLGENTADNGGLRLAFMAFMAEAAATNGNSGQPNLNQKQDGLTPVQHLFVGWAQNWCSTMRPELIRMRVQTDPHSPDRIRANAVVMNMQEFGQAFGCKRGQPMYPVKMCRVW
jgi:putative endopeptidase